MPGPAPKHPSTRARRNKASTRATLTKPSRPRVPKMPAAPLLVEYDEDKQRHAHEVDWHGQVKAWWTDVWSSPMSGEWDDSDVHNLYICLLLQQDMWTASSARDRQAAAAEYRLQRKDLGLTPLDRRKLEWQIEVTEDAKAKGEQRRRTAAPAKKAPSGKKDPRAPLSIVS